jgi:hypothetical protein
MSNEFQTGDLIALDGDLVGKSSPEVMQLALEYANLAALPIPLEQQADRLGEILEQAMDNRVLSFWITEIDHMLGHHLGLLDEDARESYRDQQVLLREYVETKRENFPVPVNRQISDYLSPSQSTDGSDNQSQDSPNSNNEPVRH